MEFDIDDALAGVHKKRTHQEDIDRYNALKHGGSPPSNNGTTSNTGEVKPAAKSSPVAETPVPIVTTPQEIKQPEPEGLEVKVSNEERPGVDNSSQQSEKKVRPIINWKAFKEVDKLFEYIGGERPVGLFPNIKRSQVSGMPEPLITFLQSVLFTKYDGIIANLPYRRSYRVNRDNKVFRTKSSLMRYLMFYALNDIEDGLGTQLAKQWFALNTHYTDHVEFDYVEHMQPNSDEFDIYALLVVSDQVKRTMLKQNAINNVPINDVSVEEQLKMLNANNMRLLKKLNKQEELIIEQSRRNDMTQTLLLLDRMGLLKGSIPKNIDDLVSLLEQNRQVLSDTSFAIDNHIIAEDERQTTLLQQQRKDELNNKRFNK